MFADLTLQHAIGIVLISILFGGGAGFMAGRATAQAWRSPLSLALYMLLLAAAVRFLHFAMAGDSLWSLSGYLLDLVCCAIGAALGFRLTRARQMVTQYYWLYERTGPFSVRRKPDAAS